MWPDMCLCVHMHLVEDQSEKNFYLPERAASAMIANLESQVGMRKSKKVEFQVGLHGARGRGAGSSEKLRSNHHLTLHSASANAA